MHYYQDFFLLIYYFQILVRWKVIENDTIQLKSIYYKTNIYGKNVPYVGIVIIVDVGLIRFAQWFTNKRLFQTTMIKIKG